MIWRLDLQKVAKFIMKSSTPSKGEQKEETPTLWGQDKKSIWEAPLREGPSVDMIQVICSS